MPQPSGLSITTEIDAITSGMYTDAEGMEAFRLAGGEAVRALEHLEGSAYTDVSDVVTAAMSRLSESGRIEDLKETRPDEFAVGVAIHAYKAKKGQA